LKSKKKEKRGPQVLEENQGGTEIQKLRGMEDPRRE
jgi:hypothetical protein